MPLGSNIISKKGRARMEEGMPVDFHVSVHTHEYAIYTCYKCKKISERG